jgi:hypothetical protein
MLVAMRRSGFAWFGKAVRETLRVPNHQRHRQQDQNFA